MSFSGDRARETEAASSRVSTAEQPVCALSSAAQHEVGSDSALLQATQGIPKSTPTVPRTTPHGPQPLTTDLR